MVNWEFFDNQTPESAIAARRRPARRRRRSHSTRGAAGSAPGARPSGCSPASPTAAPTRARPPARPSLRRPADRQRARLDGTRRRDRTAARRPAPTTRRGDRAGRPGAPRPRRRRRAGRLTDTADPGPHRLLGRRPQSWTLDAYEAPRRLRAPSRKALAHGARRRHRRGQGLRPARPRRRRLPDRHEVGLHPAGRRPKPNYLVVNADESEPGTCKDIPLMMASPHTLIEGVIITSLRHRLPTRLHLRPRRGAPRRTAGCSAPSQEAYARRPPRQEHPRLGLRPRPHRARRRRRLHLRRGDRAARLARGPPRPAAAAPAVPRASPASTPARRWSTTSSRSPRCPAIIARRRRLVRRHGHREVHGLRHLQPLGPRHQPRPVRGAARHHAARAARPRRRHARGPRAEVLDAGRLARRRCSPTSTSTCRSTSSRSAAAGSMLGTRALQIFDETTCVVRAVARWTEFYAHESCGKCTPVPRGHVVAGADRWTALEHGPGHARTTSTSCSTSATTSSAAAFCALGDGATSPITSSSIQYFRDEYLAHLPATAAARPRAGPVRPTPVRSRPAGWSPHDRHEPHRGWQRRRQGRQRPVPNPDLVTLTIDGVEVSVPKDTLVIRAAEQVGIADPALLRPPAARPGRRLPPVPGRRRPTPATAAACPSRRPPARSPVAEGMVVNTQATSPVADKAQQGIMEFLLINHPLDCPVCDKGGECPLQNQAMSQRPRPSRRFDGRQAHLPQADQHLRAGAARPRALRAVRPLHPVLRADRRRPVHRADRARRAAAGRHLRGASPFESYFSGNTVQICPVGALTGAAYRFRSPPVRPGLDAVASCEHCACGCAHPHRPPPRQGAAPAGRRRPRGQRGVELRQGPLGLPLRHAAGDRIDLPAGARRATASCGRVVARGPRRRRAAGLARAPAAAGVLTGGRLTAEDAYAYGKFARVVLGTNDVDFRARPHSAEEADFLAAHVVATGPDGGAVTYADLEAAPAVLLVGFEPEDESPIVFLRLRKAVRTQQTAVYAVAPVRDARPAPRWAARLLADRPRHRGRGARRPGLGRRPAAPAAQARRRRRRSSSASGSPPSPGALPPPPRLAAATGARLAWVPRRAGERGALEAGACRALLPGGRPVADAAARVEVAAAWGVAALPGRRPAATRPASSPPPPPATIDGLVVGGVDPADLRRPGRRRAAALEQRASSSRSSCASPPVTAVADVVLPVAPQAEKAGTYVNWEGRVRAFEEALDEQRRERPPGARHARRARWATSSRPAPQREIHAQFEALGPWGGARATSAPAGQRDAAAPEGTGDFVLSTWRHAARRRPHAGRRAVPRRHRTARRSPGSPRPRPPRSASSTATTSPSPAPRAASRCPRSSPRAWSTASSGSRPTPSGCSVRALRALGRRSSRWPRRTSRRVAAA